MKLETHAALGDIMCYHSPFGSMVLMLLLLVASAGCSFSISMAGGDPIMAFVPPMTIVTMTLSFCSVFRATRVQTTLYVSKVISMMMTTNPEAYAAVKQPNAKRREEILHHIRWTHAGHGFMLLLAVCAVLVLFIAGIGVPELIKHPTFYVIVVSAVNVIVVSILTRHFVIPTEALAFFHMYTAETDPTQIGVLPS